MKMSLNYVKDVMESMGWTNGSYLPIANDENQKILEIVTALTKNIAEKESQLQKIENRSNNLEEHYKNAEAGIDQNLKLLSAYRSQTTAEQHMLKVTKRESSKITQDLQNVNKEIEEVKNYENTTEKEIKKFKSNIDKLTKKIHWAKSALLEWEEAMQKGDETNKLILKYCKYDENKATALENRRRILQDNINKQRKILINFCEEEKSVEQALNRTAELYRKNHAERRNLVDTWKEAVNQMIQRESDIQTTEKDLTNATIFLQNKQVELKEQEDFLNQLIINNKEIESDISVLNEETSVVRRRLDKIIDSVSLKENEVNILKKQLQGTVQHVNNQRQRNRQVIQEKSDKEIQIYNNEADYKQLKERYERFVNKHMSAQERLSMLEDMVDTEEKAKDQLAKETTRINGILFRSQQQLLKLKDEDIILNAENKALEHGIMVTKMSTIEERKKLQKQIEVDYNIGFQAQLLDMRITKMQGGGISLEELGRQNDRMHKLEIEAEATTRQLTKVKTQIEKLESDMKHLTQTYNEDVKEIERMNYKIKEAQLYVEGGGKQMKITTQRNQEKIVELSILKMRVHEMESQISKCDDKVYNLEKHRIELERKMKERMIDIKIQLDLLTLKRKHYSDEYGTLKMDLGERQIKIEASKKRYEIGLELLGRNEDGSIVTATQLRIETAQEKQMLLQDGNELNDKVLKAESEIKAMENTLCLLNYSNNSYRKTFEKLDDQNPEYIELQNLQTDYCELLQRFKQLKSSLKNRSTEIDESLNRREIIDKELEEQIRIRSDNSEILMKVHKEVLDQNVKLLRAEREIKSSCKAVHQRSFNANFLVIFEKDLNLRELEDKIGICLQLLADLIDANYDIAPEISRLLCEKGLKIPQVKRSRSTPGTSWRSEFSEISFTASSKGNSSYMSDSSRSDSSKACSCTSVISIDFPQQAGIFKKIDQKKSKKKNDF